MLYHAASTSIDVYYDARQSSSDFSPREDVLNYEALVKKISSLNGSINGDSELTFSDTFCSSSASMRSEIERKSKTMVGNALTFSVTALNPPSS